MPGFGEAEQGLLLDPATLDAIAAASPPPAIDIGPGLGFDATRLAPSYNRREALASVMALANTGETRDLRTYLRAKEFMRRAQPFSQGTQGELGLGVPASVAKPSQALGTEEPFAVRVVDRRPGSPITAFSPTDPIDALRSRWRELPGVAPVSEERIHRGEQNGIRLEWIGPDDPIYGSPPAKDASAGGLPEGYIPREDVMRFTTPEGRKGYLVRVGSEGEGLVVDEGTMNRFLGERSRVLGKLESRQGRVPSSVPDPAVDLAGTEFAAPGDLGRYDRSESRQWRRISKNLGQGKSVPGELSSGTSLGYLDGEDPDASPKGKRKGGFFKPYGGAINLATRDSKGIWSRARRDDQGYVPGGRMIDPAASVTVYDGDPDSTASWDRQREVSLAEFVATLNDKYKTPVTTKESLDSSGRFISDPEPLQPDLPGGTATRNRRVGFLRVTERLDSPLLVGLDLPEIKAAREAGARSASVDLPVYEAGGRRRTLYRIGHPLKRKIEPLLRELNEVTGFATTVELDEGAKVSSLQHKLHKGGDSLRRVPGSRLGALFDGYDIFPTDNPFLERYVARSSLRPEIGESGYLIRPTIFAKGGINTGLPTPEAHGKIIVSDAEWQSPGLSKQHRGVGLFSEEPGVRMFLDSGRGQQAFNPEGWSTMELLDEIAAHWGAEPQSAPTTAGFDALVDPVNLRAIPLDSGIGAAVAPGPSGIRSVTGLEGVASATQAIAGRARYVQPRLPGIARGSGDIPSGNRDVAQESVVRQLIAEANQRMPRELVESGSAVERSRFARQFATIEQEGAIRQLIAEARQQMPRELIELGTVPERARFVRQFLASRGVTAPGSSPFVAGGVRSLGTGPDATAQVDELSLDLEGRGAMKGFGIPMEEVIRQELSGRSAGAVDPVAGRIDVLGLPAAWRPPTPAVIPGADVRAAADAGYDLSPQSSLQPAPMGIRSRQLAPGIEGVAEGVSMAQEAEEYGSALRDLLRRIRAQEQGAPGGVPAVLFRPVGDTMREVPYAPAARSSLFDQLGRPARGVSTGAVGIGVDSGSGYSATPGDSIALSDLQLEELTGRPSGATWSDLVDARDPVNRGMTVKSPPVAMDRELLPYAAFAQRIAGLSADHAAYVADAALRSAGSDGNAAVLREIRRMVASPVDQYPIGRRAGPYATAPYYGLGGDASPYQQPMTAAGAAGGFDYRRMVEGLNAPPGSPEHNLAMAQLAMRVKRRNESAAPPA